MIGGDGKWGDGKWIEPYYSSDAEALQKQGLPSGVHKSTSAGCLVPQSDLSEKYAETKAQALFYEKLHLENEAKIADLSKRNSDLEAQLGLSEVELSLLRDSKGKINKLVPLPSSLLEQAATRATVETKVLSGAIKKSWRPIRSSFNWAGSVVAYSALCVGWYSKNLLEELCGSIRSLRLTIKDFRYWFDQECPNKCPRFAAALVSMLWLAWLSPFLSVGYQITWMGITAYQDSVNNSMIIPLPATPEHDREVKAQAQREKERIAFDEKQAMLITESLDAAGRKLQADYQKWEENNKQNEIAAQQKIKDLVQRDLQEGAIARTAEELTKYHKIEQLWLREILLAKENQKNGKISEEQLDECVHYWYAKIQNIIDSQHPSLLKDYCRIAKIPTDWPQSREKGRMLTDLELAVLADTIQKSGTEWDAVQEAQKAYHALHPDLPANGAWW